jgi:dTDP-4-dehydrorhamnose reductase
MKVLVLGRNGQPGHDLLAAAASRDDVDPEGLDRARLDLRDIDTLDERLADSRFDVLVNCAAYPQVDAAEATRRWLLR